MCDDENCLRSKREDEFIKKLQHRVKLYDDMFRRLRSSTVNTIVELESRVATHNYKVHRNRVERLELSYLCGTCYGKQLKAEASLSDPIEFAFCDDCLGTGFDIEPPDYEY